MQLVFAFLAVIFFVLAGFDVRASRCAPEWFAFACAVLAWAWPAIAALD